MTSSSLQERIQNAVTFLEKSQRDQARAELESILSEHPDQPDATHLLGVLLFQCSQHQHGTQLVVRSIELAPSNISFRLNYVGILQALNNIQDAIAQLSIIIKQDPNNISAHLQLGQINIGQHDLEAAETALRHTLDLSPNLHPALVGLAQTLFFKNIYDEAEQHLQNAIRQVPDHAPSLTLLGNIQLSQGRLNEALTNYSLVADKNPQSTVAHYNRANALFLQKKLGEAKLEYQRAIALSPNMAEAHAHLGKCLMTEGNFAGGWPEYEWRWKGEGFTNTQAPAPLWDGTPLPGKTLLITTEQGYGDAFQFGRFITQAAQISDARIIVEAQAEITNLMNSIDGVDQVVPRGTALPPYSVQVPLMTLPLILRTSLETIPAPSPFIYANPKVRERWNDEISSLPGKKIGLIWRGNPDQLHNVYRSCPVTNLVPLFKLKGITFIGLQKDPTDAELNALPDLVDFGRRLQTFDDTAAIMSQLDLVISVCTSTAHLAGALGRPTWVMLSSACDWRWFIDRTDCPWYPSAQLFRQSKLHDWHGVVERLAQALQNGPAQ